MSDSSNESGAAPGGGWWKRLAGGLKRIFIRDASA